MTSTGTPGCDIYTSVIELVSSNSQALLACAAFNPIRMLLIKKSVMFQK